MSTNGHLKFQGTNRATFVGATSNIMFDTTSTSLGIGVTGTDHPSSNLYITGNAYVTSDIGIGGVLTMGTVNVVARHDLESVTATGNTTPLTVEFQNADTSLVASGKVEVGKELTVTGNTTVSSNLTVSGDVEVAKELTVTGNATVSSNLTVSGNVEVGTANLFVDTVNSNIGLGTVSPAQSLHVSKVVAGGVNSILVSNPNGTVDSSAALKLGVSAEDDTVAKFGIIHERKSPYGGGDTYFCTNYAADTTEVSETDAAITILGQNKHVGIGESDPATVLHISKDYFPSGGNSTHFTPQIYISGEGQIDGSQVSAIGFNGNAAAGTHKRMVGGGIYYKGGGGNYGLGGYLGLAVANLSSGGADPYGITEGELESQTRLTIGNDGNVGIGTLSANSPLEIYTDDGALSQGGGLRIHHITGSPKIEFVRGGPNRSPNTNVFGASNYTDWRFGCAGPNISFSRQNTGGSGAGVGNEAIVMQIQYNGPILSQLDSGWTLNNTNQGNGDDNTAVSLYRDYNSWISIFKHTWLNGGGGWGTFWAGNAGAAYSRISTDNNPNEYVLVGGGAKRFTFDLDSGGHAYFDGTLSQNSYDYAEYFEWEDGNPDNEDRRGYSVVLCENGKIKKAISDDEPADIFGIVSGTSGVIGDSACYDWQGKYEVDEWGTIVTDEVYQLTWSDEDNKNHTYDEDRVPEGVTVPDDVSRRLHNRKRIRPEYDASRVYIPRDKRKEWCPVGLLGKVRLRDGCPTNPNWRYMKTVAGKQLWLIR